MNILEHSDNVMLKFNIKCKSVRIVSDDAANMRKAFQLQLNVPDQDEQEVIELGELCEVLEEFVDSDEEMEDAGGAVDTESTVDAMTLLEMEKLEDELSAKLEAMFLSSDQYKRIGCFNDALHNVVGDGLKFAGSRISNVLGKVKYWVVLLHKSSKFLTAWMKLLRGSCLWKNLLRPGGIHCRTSSPLWLAFVNVRLKFSGQSQS